MSTKPSQKSPLARLNSGYIGSEERWTAFFSIIISDTDISAASGISLDLLTDGFDRRIASDELIATEARTGFALPRSYKDFILAGGMEISNRLAQSISKRGGHFVHPQEIGKLVDKFPIVIADIMSIPEMDYPDEQYYVYFNYSQGEDRYLPAMANFKPDRLYDFYVLQIKDQAEQIGFVTTDYTLDDEFEAWRYSPTEGGALRCRSFAEIYAFFIFNLLNIVRGFPKRKSVSVNDLIYIGADNVLNLDVLSKQWRA